MDKIDLNLILDTIRKVKQTNQTIALVFDGVTITIRPTNIQNALDDINESFFKKDDNG